MHSPVTPLCHTRAPDQARHIGFGKFAFKAKEMISSTLATIHNEYFTVKLVADIRQAMRDGAYSEFKSETLGRFYAGNWGRVDGGLG